MSLYDHAADTVRAIFDRRLEGPAVLDTERYFPQAGLFVESWQAIQAEALALIGRLSSVPRFHELMKAQETNSANDNRDWRIFIMKVYGHEVKQNLGRCPMTAGILRQCPEVLSASFSFLAPGKYIPPHRGPFRGVMRFHLGLSMPPGDDGLPGCVMNVDNVPYRLGNGDWLLWDDTYTHELVNRAQDVRVALLLDVWRPDMPADMRALSHAIVGVARIGAALQPAHAYGR
jgi:aspartate beta-hydroxylase